MSAGRKKDPIWVYYNEKIELGKKGSKAICKLCQKEMQGLVSRMIMHHEVCVAKNEVEKKKDCEQEKDALDVTATYNRGTDNKAQIESQNLPDPCNKRIQCDEDLTATDTDIKIKKFKTTDISPFIVKTPTNLKDTLDLQVAKFFFSSNIPFRSVENPHFLKLIQMLRPGYKPPSKIDLGNRLLNAVHEHEIEKITGELSEQTISVVKVSRGLTFYVDSNGKSGGLKMKVRRRLALRSPLYVGGVPEDMGDIHKVVLESFKGCIRNFHLNGKYLDIAREELQHVGQCFSTIEPGAYFPGDAYAIYDKNFNLGIKLDIQVEFKTKRQNGILLALSEGFGIPSIALELNNGSVVISVILGNEEKPFSAVRTFESAYHVCDGQWHMVTAQYAHKAVTLKVDLFDVVVGLSESVPLEPNTATPLYIGGVPDDAPTGALLGRNNFVGCLRNIAINDRRVEWIDMAARHNVGPTACPTF